MTEKRLVDKYNRHLSYLRVSITDRCNLACLYCVPRNLVPKLSHDDILSYEEILRIVRIGVKLGITKVRVTGGEPLTWNMAPLTGALKERGMKIHIETSGAYPVTGQWDWICLSPKKTKLPVGDIYERADELKVIVYNKHDFAFAEQQAERVGPDCLLFLQPEWSVREKVTPLIVEYVMANPRWRVSLQTHKYLNIP